MKLSITVNQPVFFIIWHYYEPAHSTLEGKHTYWPNPHCGFGGSLYKHQGHGEFPVRLGNVAGN